MHFRENQDLTSVTPNDPMVTFDPRSGKEGLKLIHMHKLRKYTMKHRRNNAFLVKIKL